ncbi:hypothetical protein TRFO_11963 [Tritrichomonas foetus]|uniref:Uncharacterized protein n=1 Tax=Tritrichomonas foetus TaxID=1144522 RepID=A0A1J4J7H5_9EUKA|nr:hypothetical protein TRFO_11963 [Tritrichomonas foetus]|eukprot:OHS93156.1 hypothetical protein TRFO_11963 [Tritrichomonas foetus]
MENQNQTSIQIQQELPTMLPVTLPTTPTTPEVVSEQFCFIDVPDFVVDDYFAFDLSDPTEFSFDEESQEFPYSY